MISLLVRMYSLFSWYLRLVYDIVFGIVFVGWVGRLKIEIITIYYICVYDINIYIIILGKTGYTVADHGHSLI